MPYDEFKAMKFSNETEKKILEDSVAPNWVEAGLSLPEHLPCQWVRTAQRRTISNAAKSNSDHSDDTRQAENCGFCPEPGRNVEFLIGLHFPFFCVVDDPKEATLVKDGASQSDGV